jgi:hypothetical protein
LELWAVASFCFNPDPLIETAVLQNRPNMGPPQTANPDSEWVVVPVKINPARSEASRAGKFATNSQNQNMENLSGT